jgi:RNA polymerase sigma factor (sigma-70 family)
VDRALDNQARPSGIAALTRGLAAGHEPAFREFHAQYFTRLYQFLLVVARGQEHEAREAVQETLLRVARYAKPFETEDAFWCWLKAVARSAARDGGRKRTRYAALLHYLTQDQLTDTSATAPTNTPKDNHLNNLLQETLAELDAPDRQLVVEKYAEGATVKELSARSGASEKSVESRLHRLRRHLRERLLKKLQSP